MPTKKARNAWANSCGKFWKSLIWKIPKKNALKRIVVVWFSEYLWEKILISNTLNINSSVSAIEKWSNIDKEIVANEFILHDLWKKQKNSVENKMI